jgi:hypothetical protein
VLCALAVVPALFLPRHPPAASDAPPPSGEEEAVAVPV